MRTRSFNWLLPLALLLLTQCGNPDGTDSFRESMDDREEGHTDYRRQERDSVNPDDTGDNDTVMHLPPE